MTQQSNKLSDFRGTTRLDPKQCCGRLVREQYQWDRNVAYRKWWAARARTAPSSKPKQHDHYADTIPVTKYMNPPLHPRGGLLTEAMGYGNSLTLSTAVAPDTSSLKTLMICPDNILSDWDADRRACFKLEVCGLTHYINMIEGSGVAKKSGREGALIKVNVRSCALSRMSKEVGPQSASRGQRRVAAFSDALANRIVEAHS